jgi:hypothetical protein
MKKLIVSLSVIFFSTGCTTQEAVIMGAIPGRIIGTPIGMVATALDESVKTAADVVSANPRYSRAKNVASSKPAYQYQNYKAVTPTYRGVDNSHYYKAEVLIKTRGAAKFESIQLMDSREVTDFWR